ncbi:caspase family protein [Virgisporangium ochraceum]|uniref:Peptidase C14 caspase domain-containing protein n=1 Tax=Virgisporangium ochraceum TaxID=65505 RepID=A0A8J3ZU25_9ACTN|nr:caspase family protein [Virgisporangium ochraceum]GIJ70202.1 hypothetical protein Voc01_051190 [Virgisporangium ochraceum]
MKRALLVGVDDYANFGALSGCCNDVVALHPLLSRHADESKNFDCVTMLSSGGPVTRDELLEAIDQLLSPAVDVAIFYFAGHGHQLANDVALVTSDGTPTTPGVLFSEVLTKIANSPIPEVIVILDCCFSGAAGGVPQLGDLATFIRRGTSILAAARADQTASETPAGRGMFSTYLCDALEGGAADILGKVTVAGVYAHLSEMFGAWDQRPTFKANIDRLHDLRRTLPAMELVQLRHMMKLFPRSDFVFPLSPSYEPDVLPHDEKNEADFAILQKGRDAKLLRPVGEKHLYYAAVNSKACELTALGRHYWILIDRDLI